jgi:hypothetical protein
MIDIAGAGFFMPGTSNGLTQAQIDRRLKGGRGQGQGPDYKPLIYTRDVSSLGRSPRLLGSHAFHTPMMQAMQESFLAVTGKVETDLKLWSVSPLTEEAEALAEH